MGIKEFKENTSRTTSSLFTFYPEGSGYMLALVAPGIKPESISAKKSGEFIRVSGSVSKSNVPISGTYSFKDIKTSIKVGNDVQVSSANYENGIIFIKLVEPDEESEYNIDIQLPESKELNETTKTTETTPKRKRTRRKSTNDTNSTK